MNARKLALLAIPALIFVGDLTGCKSGKDETGEAPKYTAVISQKENMTLDQAKAIITETFLNAPIGRRPHNPGFESLAKETVGVRTRSRRDYCLVEVMGEEKAFLKFYTRNEADAKKFAEALSRIKAEYAE